MDAPELPYHVGPGWPVSGTSVLGIKMALDILRRTAGLGIAVVLVWESRL